MKPAKPIEPRRFHRVRRVLEPVIRPAMHAYWRFSRPATLGVRAIVIDGQGRIFLVKHSYVDGWHFPGGGVETGETLLEALARELAEEGNIVLSATPRLHGVFFNKRISRRDHVALYIVREFRQDSAPQPDHEIVEHGFFPLSALPEDTTRATRARIAEVFEQAAISELW
jgi:8-oxo-dGTP pyrophosphatase MutT (NUDIX family)